MSLNLDQFKYNQDELCISEPMYVISKGVRHSVRWTTVAHVCGRFCPPPVVINIAIHLTCE